MDKHVAMDHNNPINCTDELNLCKECGTEITKDDEGFEHCEYCEECTCCGVEMTKKIREVGLCPTCLEHI